MAHLHTIRQTRLAPATSSATPTSGSQTILQTEPHQPSATLRLRATSPEPASASTRRIQWAEDVVDNEGMGKKSSKVCCIYHKPHGPGDSDSDSDSDSESDDSSEPDLSRAYKAGGGRRGRGRKDSSGDSKKERKPSPNAYERQPRNKVKKEE